MGAAPARLRPQCSAQVKTESCGLTRDKPMVRLSHVIPSYELTFWARKAFICVGNRAA